MELKKIFSNYISDKGLISKIYEELIQLKSKNKTKKKTNKTPLKMDRETEDIFFYKVVQVASISED